MNFAQEIELETGDYPESPELALRIECMERRLLNLEAWLSELASDVLDRLGIPRMEKDCEIERIGS